MITYEEALKTVLASAQKKETETVPLESSTGRVLASDIYADMDMPPFNKSAVDGFACRLADLNGLLTVVEEIPAGKAPQKVIEKGACAKIMTGAMVPEGADTVVMVEFTEQTADGQIRFTAGKTSPNICYTGEDIKQGRQVLAKGTLLRPQDIAVLASVGVSMPMVYQQPVVGIISTGDELVEPAVKPAASQIRNSNAVQTVAQVTNAGAIPRYFGIAKDTEQSTHDKLSEAITACDMVILTGGVSMGEYDYVPKLLGDQGVEILFKSLAMQPGRPTVFGVKPGKYIFGLPGNPVSSFVQFEMLVKPLIYAMMGHNYQPPKIALPMGVTFSRKKTTRKTLIPVFFEDGKVYPVEYHGSAHIHAYIYAHGIVAMEMGRSELKKGELVDVRQI